MFNVTARPSFTRTVTIQTPEGDGFREDSLKATFRVTPSSEFNLHRVVDQKAFLAEAVTGLDEVVGEDDAPIPFSAELLDQLQWTALDRLGALPDALRNVMEERTRQVAILKGQRWLEATL